jgi:proline dehydrogenase
MDWNPLFRKGILLATQNRFVKTFVRRYGMRLGAARFVAGETLDACVSTLRGLNDKGLYTNTTLLGEHVDDEAAINNVVAVYLQILDRIASDALKTNIALKLTHLGLDFGVPVALKNVKEIVSYAREKGNFVRIDMEESERVDATLEIYRELRKQGFDNVGTVLQAYLYRSEADLKALLPLRPNLRFVKGAYLEPATVAFPEKADVDKNFIQLIELSLMGEGYTAVATHDEKIIDHTIAFAKAHGVPKGRFEFQMLYGVRPEYQLELVSRGYKVLIATPYGPDWYPYLMRRLAERPANLLFMLRNLLRR